MVSRFSKKGAPNESPGELLPLVATAGEGILRTYDKDVFEARMDENSIKTDARMESNILEDLSTYSFS